ncbi:hypothetical protein SBA2_670047 [Acidobacteriia bacterium SbA2]|nr:hypothetical protein SBA2_670047 [Acidobacteriia bacterium SbA2]
MNWISLQFRLDTFPVPVKRHYPQAMLPAQTLDKIPSHQVPSPGPALPHVVKTCVGAD